MSYDMHGESNPCYRHGHSPKGSMTTEYRIWAAMKTRCSNRKQPHYHRYGGRGITVCRRWASSFENFLRDMGPRPPGKSLDRIDNDKGYSPTNCRWATPKEQARNSRTVKMVVVRGESMTLTEAAAAIGVNRDTLTKRMRSRGLTAQQAVDQPLGPMSAGVRAAWARKKGAA